MPQDHLRFILFVLSSSATWKQTSKCTSSNARRRCREKCKRFQVPITRNLWYHQKSSQALCQLPAAKNAPLGLSAKHVAQAWTRLPCRQVCYKQTLSQGKVAEQEELPVLQVKQANGFQAEPTLVRQDLQQYLLLFSLVTLSSYTVTQEKQMWLKQTFICPSVCNRTGTQPWPASLFLAAVGKLPKTTFPSYLLLLGKKKKKSTETKTTVRGFGMGRTPLSFASILQIPGVVSNPSQTKQMYIASFCKLTN